MKKIMLLCLLVGSVISVQGQFSRDNCHGRCFAEPDFAYTCQCHKLCESLNDCCYDFYTRCRGPETGFQVSEQELSNLAQKMWDSDVDRIDPNLYTLDYQGHTNCCSTEDHAVNNLIVPTDSQLDTILANKASYKTFMALLDNYEENAQNEEHRHQNEIDEENAFWQAISNTTVVQLAFKFLQDEGFIRNDIRAMWLLFEEMWFNLYAPDYYSPSFQRPAKTSGFEHVFVGQKMNPKFAGLNNWIRYYDLEKQGKIDYKGFFNHTQNPNMANVTFSWDDTTGNCTGFFIGTSPQFDLSLFTVCALTRPYNYSPCKLTINSNRIEIPTSTRHHQNRLEVMSAYPCIDCHKRCH